LILYNCKVLKEYETIIADNTAITFVILHKRGTKICMQLSIENAAVLDKDCLLMTLFFCKTNLTKSDRIDFTLNTDGHAKPCNLSSFKRNRNRILKNYKFDLNLVLEEENFYAKSFKQLVKELKAKQVLKRGL